MITFNIDNMFIDEHPIPINIVFNYSPLEVSYICFTHNYDQKTLKFMIFEQLKSMRCDIPTTKTYNYPLTMISLLNTYSFPLNNNELLKYMMIRYRYNNTNIKIFESLNSINVIDELNRINLGRYEPYVNPNASLRQIIDLVISNHPNDTISLLYYQHKYVILGLSLIYFKLVNIPSWLRYGTANWFDLCKIEDNPYIEAFQTLNYLINFEALECKQTLLYFDQLYRLFIFKDITNNTDKTKNIVTDLYRCAGLSDNEIFTFASNKRDTVIELIHNLDIINEL